MKNEHGIPEEATQPQPKNWGKGKTSFGSAAKFVLGLTIAGGLARELPQDNPPVSDTTPTTEVQKVPEKTAEQKEAALRARLESLMFVSGIQDPKFANPDNMYTNKFTPEFIDWILAFEFADAGAREQVLGIGVPDLAHAILESMPPSEKFDRLFQVAEIRYKIEKGKDPKIQKKMPRGDADRYIKLLIETEIVREP